MIFHPQSLKPMEGVFRFSHTVTAIAHSCLDKDIIRAFWNSFSCGCSTLAMTPCEDYRFSLGNAAPLPLSGADYSIRITHDGICVSAEGARGLIDGLMTLLDRFQAVDGADGLAIEIPCGCIAERALVKTRMAHFCIFPETELWELRRFLRLCGALKYTHVVLEFWGMLQYDVMKELAWSHAFSKEEVAPLISEARDLGLEIVPMFNHWGHASAGRVRHGKHVVLDQAPHLQTYFSEDGWCWDIGKPKVRALLRQVRSELIALCGEGSYFHMGCDEAYNFAFSKENMDAICDLVNEVSAEMTSLGRRALVWGDMFLYRYPHYNVKNHYDCNAPSPEAEQYMLSRLSRDVIIADWQYNAVQGPVETCEVFEKAGFDCLLCPWDRGAAQIRSVTDTVKAHHLMGYMHTTWHTLSAGMPFVVLTARQGFEDPGKTDMQQLLTATAALLRRVMPAEGIYERSGWSRIQIDSLW